MSVAVITYEYISRHAPTAACIGHSAWQLQVTATQGIGGLGKCVTDFFEAFQRRNQDVKEMGQYLAYCKFKL